MQSPATGLEKSSTGLDANVAGLLTYLLGFVTGIVFLVIEKDSKFVRFHALQSTLLFGGLFVLHWFIAVAAPLVGVLFLSPLIALATFILWIILMIKAYQGEKFKLPVVGDIAEQKS
jgi:uncharacterized membrane protein